ncbi:MAG: hydantoinase/oxoprolinase N-terminal domain-containing protein, partial [Armatimonadota bacterium]
MAGGAHDPTPRPWRIHVDTGGTFTDCLAVAPDGTLHRAKVLSSGVLRERTPDGDVASVPTGLEAPVVAAHVVTGTPLGKPLPPCRMRLATTRGTNALLTRTTAAPVLWTTRGFGDLPRIGHQQRPDLFAIAPVLPEPWHGPVVEVSARLAANGTELAPLDE